MTGQFYRSGAYLRNNPTYHVEDAPWKAQQILDMLRRHELEPRTIYEVGCGAGEILAQLRDALPDSVELVGFDTSPQAIELCQARASERLRYECSDLLTADVPPADLLLCIDVFEHVDDYMAFLRGLRAKADYVMFHIPLDMSAQMVFRAEPIRRVRSQVGHLHYFMKDTALTTLADTGYEVIDWRYTASGIERPKSWRARMMRMPRRMLFALAEDLIVRTLGGYSMLALAR